MSQLRQNTITVRGEQYTVSEMNGRVMQDVRKLLANDPHLAPARIVLMCTVDPKQTQLSVEQLPQAVIDAIVLEVTRLGKDDEGDGKNV